jgi:type II secretory pathway component GspD/PulD (secretin)
VRTGQTIVIGGLMEDRKTETVSKFPILGDIPGIGEFFKRRQNSTTKTELLIFLTPHVATQPEVLENMGKDELQGTKLVPNAVTPGTFEQQKQGLERAEPPTPEPWSHNEPEIRGGDHSGEHRPEHGGGDGPTTHPQ